MSAKTVDAAVQHTNDDSVVSKRSAGKLGYVYDDYLRFFVKKLSRRSPLINRGYALRIVALTHLIEGAIGKLSQLFPEQRVQVVSLGAGFDTVAARMYERPGLQHVHFYDVDFPEVIRNKVNLMQAAPMSKFPFHASPGGDGIPTVTHGELFAYRYSALGADLRDGDGVLGALLRSGGGYFSPALPTVLYAECVMQYMPADSSTSLISLIAERFPNAFFFAYDQIHPLDSFGQVMTRTLKLRNSPLLGITSLPDGLSLRSRALACNLHNVRFDNFYDLSRLHFSGAELRRIERLEPFDEYEEWAEMCEHYGILGGASHPSLHLFFRQRQPK